jgi:exodeoxyribonuclease VII large subunit
MRGRHVAELTHDLQRGVRTRILVGARRLDVLRTRLEAQDLRRRMGNVKSRVMRAQGRLDAAMTRRRHLAGARLGSAAARLEGLSPLAVLGRGYAVCWDADRAVILRDAAGVEPGARLRVTLARGELEARVTGSRPPEN